MAAKHTELIQCLKELHLPTVRESFLKTADQARAESYSYENFLYQLMQQEQENRQHNRIARFLKESRLPLEKTLANLDRKRLPRKVDQLLSILIESHFVTRAENVLAFGNPGSGKTHLLCALTHELIQQGYRCRFVPCSHLVQELLRAKRDLKLERVLKQLSRYDVLFIDDIGYVQQSREEMEVLFTLLADRYERKSVMLTSNLPFSKWERIFKDPMTTAAAIDRLVHHSVILELNLTSYRLEASKAKTKVPTGGGARTSTSSAKPGMRSKPNA
jgi:DNA replication protein DnaC